MKIKIDVKDEEEAKAIRVALDDEVTRALIVTMGCLLPLDKAARRRTLNWIMDKYEIDPTPKG